MQENSAVIFSYNNRHLCPVAYEDLDKFKNWRNQQMDILRQWKPLTEYNQNEWFKQLSIDPYQVIFSIYFSINDNKVDLIGYCGIVNIDLLSRRGEISFIVEPTRADDDYLYGDDFFAALFLLCKYGFENINLNKLYTETFCFREKHIKILENFGFTLEGELREHQYHDNIYHNSLMHSILRKEWLVNRS